MSRVRSGRFAHVNLVISGVPSYAVFNNDPVPGPVIAQALEDFDGQKGIIKAVIRKF